MRWSAADLARQSTLGVDTIRRVELAEEEAALTLAMNSQFAGRWEGAGVLFIEENGGGPGVRLHEQLKTKSRRK
jgi:hypothetical protein